MVFNNAGIMQFDDAASTIDENLLISTIAMNLFGPIRLTPALIGHRVTMFSGCRSPTPERRGKLGHCVRSQ